MIKFQLFKKETENSRRSIHETLLIFLNVLTLTLFFIAMVASHKIWAADELCLNGKVIDYNEQDGEIIVDVKTESCLGIKKFSTKPNLPKGKLMGKEIHFSINSNVCEKGKIYDITTNILE